MMFILVTCTFIKAYIITLGEKHTIPLYKMNAAGVLKCCAKLRKLNQADTINLYMYMCSFNMNEAMLF